MACFVNALLYIPPGAIHQALQYRNSTRNSLKSILFIAFYTFFTAHNTTVHSFATIIIVSNFHFSRWKAKTFSQNSCVKFRFLLNFASMNFLKCFLNCPISQVFPRFVVSKQITLLLCHILSKFSNLSKNIRNFLFLRKIKKSSNCTF